MSNVVRRTTHSENYKYRPADSFGSGRKEKGLQDDAHPSPPPNYDPNNFPQDHKGFELTKEQRIEAAPGILLEILEHPRKDGLFENLNHFYTLEAVAFNLNLDNEEARPVLKEINGIVPDVLKNIKGVPEEGYRLASREEAVENLRKKAKPQEWVM